MSAIKSENIMKMMIPGLAWRNSISVIDSYIQHL